VDELGQLGNGQHVRDCNPMGRFRWRLWPQSVNAPACHQHH
jgi:hypothetical protein